MSYSTWGTIIKVRVEFGAPATKIREINWYDDLLKMPRVIKHKDTYWEWISYDKPKHGSNDYVVIYAEATNQLQYYGFEVPDFEQMFPSFANSCECGAIYNKDFPNVHSFWCPKWEKV